MKYVEIKRDRHIKHLIKDIANKADWLQFFLIFSRFEYALKRSGYFNKYRNKSPFTQISQVNRYHFQNKRLKRVEPNWQTFGKEIERAFWENASVETMNSIKYLRDNPPYKQCVNANNEIEWQLSPSPRDIYGLITVVKTVRNNLFHGGKYPTMPVNDPSGDIQLMRHCVFLLKYMLTINQEVRRHFFDNLEEEQ